MSRVSGQGRVALLALDAGSPSLARGWAAAGHLPNFARVLAHGATAEVEHEPGLYVGSIWPTTLSGVGVARHGFYTGIRPAPFSYDYVPAPPEVDPFWVDVARSGARIATIDVPFFRASDEIDGLQVVEWGCHDRYYGTHASPPGLLEEVLRDVGRHPIGMIDHELGYERFAPCDWIHLHDRRRTADDVLAFVETLSSALDHRLRMSKYVLGRGPFDLLVDVVSETHCAGHHLWSLHDPSHPDHDPDLVERLGGDPLLAVYRELDDLLGVHLDATGDGDTLFVFLSHGMRPHFDGVALLDEVLWRLDQAYRGMPTPWVGAGTEKVASVLSRLPQGVRPHVLGTGSRLLRAVLPGGVDETPPIPIPHPAERLWYQLENNTVSGAVRFNRSGREPKGLLSEALTPHAARWLDRELRQLVNLDGGGPVVERVYLSEDLYRRRPDDGLPDLLVDWVRDRPIERVWSPTIGHLARADPGLRTGDHDGVGELIVVGPGIVPGRARRMHASDVAPTIAAAAGVFLQDRDGAPVAGLLPGGMSRSEAVRAAHHALERDDRGRRRSAAGADATSLRRELLELRSRVQGLEAAHHDTRLLAAAARAEANVATAVLATSSWLREEDVAEDLLVSVVIPTSGRLDRLRRAVGSVLDQTYRRLELVVVDDASTDATADWLAGLEDDRIIVVRNERRLGEGGSRNVGLDRASGDVVTFLDDDNTFDADWVRSVVWLFTEHPGTEVAYGARLVDDVERHHGRRGRGLPWLQLNEWDREANAENCLVDVNTLAHRRSAVRFDPELVVMTDWDYLLALTSDVDPLRFPVLACRYDTSDPDRATEVHRDRHAEMYARIRERWGGGG